MDKQIKIGIDAGDYVFSQTPKSGIQRLVVNYLLNRSKNIINDVYYFGKKAKNRDSLRLKSLPKRFFSHLFLPLSLILNQDKIFLGFSGFLPSSIRQIKIKTYIFIYDFGFYKYPEKYQNANKLTQQTNYAVNNADKIIVLSDYIKKELIARFPQMKNKVVKIYAGFDHLPEPTKKLIGFPYFLYVGVIKPTKNILSLIKLYADFIAQTKLTTKLILVGRAEENYLQQIRADRTYQKLKKNIIFTGEITDQDLVDYYHHAKAFINIAVDEGFAYPVGEALVQGIPVIVNDLPLYHEYLSYFSNLKICKNRQKMIKNMFMSRKKIILGKHPFTWKSFSYNLEKLLKL